MNLAGSRQLLALSTVMVLSVAINLFGLQGDRRRHRDQSDAAALKSTQATRDGAATFMASSDLAQAAVVDPDAPMQAKIIASVETPIDKADLVRSIQQELNARGYGAGRPDGVIGPLTRAAILDYEYAFSLPLTAQPSPELLGQIVLGSSAEQRGARANAQPGAEAAVLIEDVKRRLIKLGYTPGRQPGHFDTATADAIRRFEKDHGLPVKGRISAPVMSKLIYLDNEKASHAATGSAKKG